jgi:23S rRNA pseudouridine1911/1915/1917 synthase
MTSFLIDDEHAGRRLDVVLAAVLETSRNQVVARLAAGEITVDGALAAKQHRLRVGERVEIRARQRPEPAPAPDLPPIRYQDEHLVVVAKPPGLVVHPGAGHPDDTLVQALQAAGVPLAPAGGGERPGIVHRLDRDTSGLLIVACTDTAHERLVAALAAREIDRRYLAVVLGEPTNARGRIEAPIGRDPASRTRFGVVADGKPAVTRYVTWGSGTVGGELRAVVSLVACTLETGRTHQIRVHLAAIGHPVVGDATYGSRPAVATALGAGRPLLHAASLRFTHPVTGQQISLDEPPPDDLTAACAKVGITIPTAVDDER